MSAAVVLLIVVEAAGAPPSEDVVRVARDGVADTTRIEPRSVSRALDDAAALALAEAARATAVVEVRWGAAGTGRATVHAHLRTDGVWFDRELRFGAGASSRERARAVGLSVASLIAADEEPPAPTTGAPPTPGSPTGGAPTPLAPTPPSITDAPPPLPRDEGAPLGLVATSLVPMRELEGNGAFAREAKDERLRERGSDGLPQRRALSITGAFVGGTDAVGLGGELGAILALANSRWSFRLAGAARTATLAGVDSRLWQWGATLGARYMAFGDVERWSLLARVELGVALEEVDHTLPSGSGARLSQAVPLLASFLELDLPLSKALGVFATAGVEGSLTTVSVRVRADATATLPTVRPLAGAGLRWSL
jgi:hypothetical protein